MDTPKKRKAKRGHRGDTSSSERADRNHRDRQERLSFVHYFYRAEEDWSKIGDCKKRA